MSKSQFQKEYEEYQKYKEWQEVLCCKNAQEVIDFVMSNYLTEDEKCKTIAEQSQRIAELEEQLKNAIVLPFEFDKPFYKLCPKCNNQQEGCKNCAWQMCGFNQCFSVCHSENEGLLIKEIIFKKDNCIVSLNALNYIIKNWNKYYFATKEEAQAKLRELQGE